MISYIVYSQLLYALAFLEWLIIATAMLNAVVYLIGFIVLVARSQVAQSVERPAVYRDVSVFKSSPGNRRK